MSGQATDLDRWIADVRTAIARAAQPDLIDAEASYRTGRVMLAFVVHPGGEIGDIRVVASSGNASLDRRAVAKLRRAEPLPAGPDAAARRTEMVIMTVSERITAAARRERTDRPAYATA